jgi:uncharacterized membrane protein YcaP (DUF421 family)
LKQRSRLVDRWVEGVPLVLMKDGALRREPMERERVERSDILASAREKLGLASLAEVRHAVLERDGRISIVPWPGAGGKPRRPRVSAPRPSSG